MGRVLQASILLVTVAGLLSGQPGVAGGGEPAKQSPAEHNSDKPAAGRLTMTRTDDGWDVREGDRPVLTYQLRAKSKDGKHERSNYVHPLYDLDGNVVSEDFPDDHRHHRGIFWAWHQVRVDGRNLGDQWVCQDFRWKVLRTRSARRDDGSVRLTARLQWTSPHLDPKQKGWQPVVEETTAIHVYPRQADHRNIDFQIRLRPLVDRVALGGSEDVKGYGGFSARIKLSPETRFLGSAGQVEPVRTAVAAGPWMNIVTGRQGVAILQHASLPEYPQPWILRQSRSMQNAAWPGRHAVLLGKSDAESQVKPKSVGNHASRAVALRYRLVLHRGTTETDVLGKWHKQYASEPVLGDR